MADQRLRRVSLAFILLQGGAFAALGDERVAPPYPERGLKGTVSAKRLPAPEHPVLAAGAAIWDANCRICHGSGNFGAPKITGDRFWAKRLEKGVATLISHAQNGFQADDGGLMPARGGNDELTDAEVASAVRFMVANSGGADIALDGLN